MRGVVEAATPHKIGERSQSPMGIETAFDEEYGIDTGGIVHSKAADR